MNKIIKSYTIEQRVQIVTTYYRNGASVRATYRELQDAFGKSLKPTERTIYRLVKKFEATGSVLDIKPSIRARSGRSEKNIAAVSESLAKDPTLSLSRRSKLLGISQTTLFRILTDDLGMRLAAECSEVDDVPNSKFPLQTDRTNVLVTSVCAMENENSLNDSLEDETT